MKRTFIALASVLLLVEVSWSQPVPPGGPPPGFGGQPPGFPSGPGVTPGFPGGQPTIRPPGLSDPPGGFPFGPTIPPSRINPGFPGSSGSMPGMPGSSGGGMTWEKRCGSCLQPVVSTSSVGQTCPHCGVMWNRERTSIGSGKSGFPTQPGTTQPGSPFNPSPFPGASPPNTTPPANPSYPGLEIAGGDTPQTNPPGETNSKPFFSFSNTNQTKQITENKKEADEDSSNLWVLLGGIMVLLALGGFGLMLVFMRSPRD